MATLATCFEPQLSTRKTLAFAGHVVRRSGVSSLAHGSSQRGFLATRCSRRHERSTQRTVNRPAEIDPGLDSTGWSIEQDRPLLKRSSRAAPCQTDRVSLVVLLLKLSGPAHVTRFVVSFDVDAVERAVLRSRADVREERPEIVQPLVAHLDAASAVTMPFTVRLVRASHLSGVPSQVLRSACHAVRPRSVSGQFPTQATAAFSHAITKARAVDDSLGFAVTTTEPPSGSRRWDARDHDKATESSPSQVDNTRHLPNNYKGLAGVLQRLLEELLQRIEAWRIWATSKEDQ